MHHTLPASELTALITSWKGSLALEGEAGTNLFYTKLESSSTRLMNKSTYLVGGLVQLLGIERGTNAEGDTGAEKDIVGDGSDTTVVDLALYEMVNKSPGFYIRPGLW